VAGKGNGLLRMRQKRQRERIYLEHFFAVRQLHATQLIEGRDDGQEPDFSVCLDGVWIGIELTTLPRLRDRLGNQALLSRRLYWQAMRWLGWPFSGARRVRRSGLLVQSTVLQSDIDAVMSKKADKVLHYQHRRPLDQVWLLIHTDRVQADGLLGLPDMALLHASAFDQVWLSVYPTRRVMQVQRERSLAFNVADTPRHWHD
jgi:hypothetical protein